MNRVIRATNKVIRAMNRQEIDTESSPTTMIVTSAFLAAVYALHIHSNKMVLPSALNNLDEFTFHHTGQTSMSCQSGLRKRTVSRNTTWIDSLLL